MAKDPLKVAEARIAELGMEMENLRQFVAMYHALSGEESRQGGNVNAAESTSPKLEAPEEEFSTTVEILAAAEAVLRQEGKSLPAATIYDRLIGSGIRIAGKNPKGNLTAKFSMRRNMFHLNSATGKWSLQEWAAAETPPSPSAWINSVQPTEEPTPT